MTVRNDCAVYRLHPFEHVNGDDVRALLRQPDGVAAALAARRAGDECDLPVELATSRSDRG
jgi:hypothetical protein